VSVSDKCSFSLFSGSFNISVISGDADDAASVSAGEFSTHCHNRKCSLFSVYVCKRHVVEVLDEFYSVQEMPFFMSLFLYFQMERIGINFPMVKIMAD